MKFHPQQFKTYSLNRSPFGDDICKVLSASINAVDPYEAIKRHVSLVDEQLVIGELQLKLRNYRRIFIIGVGKAAIPMADAIIDTIGGYIYAGLIITTDGCPSNEFTLHSSKVKILRASHPIPDQRNINAGAELSKLVKYINDEDLVIFLLSGGGSSLLINPSHGLSLQDIRDTTDVLLKCGATIAEINSIRKHLDSFKGGGLARLLFPAKVVTLILSDVVGDHLDVIASGPTVDDTSIYEDAWDVLNKYQIIDKVPTHVTAHIVAGIQGKISETLKTGDPIFKTVTNIIIGNNKKAVCSTIVEARKLGFHTRLLTTSLQGEASQVGKMIVEDANRILRGTSELTKPVCMIAGGETTVTVKGGGIGGRNQELALGAVQGLSGSVPFILISMATDGVDGTTDAAGAVSTNETYKRGLDMGLHPQVFLDNNDSYHYFNTLGDLIKIGPTLTNINDILLLFVL